MSNIKKQNKTEEKLNIRRAISDYRNYVNETIVDALIKPVGVSKESFVEKFVAKYMSSALKDTSSKEAQHLASILIKPDSIEQYQTLANSSKSMDIDLILWKLNNTLYDKQQEVFSSFLHNAYKRYLIINSRRTGKTELMGRLIAANLVSQPDAHVVYINRNSSAAVRQIRKPLQTALAQTGLQVVKGSVESQFMLFNNNSQLLILGNNNSADIDKIRGERVSLCIMDECGHQRNTRQLIREVIEPAMSDYGKDAKLVLVGTPPRIPHTYVEEVYNNALSLGWKTFHWTYLENPHLLDKETLLEDVCKSNGCTPDSAFIRREYYGEMNVFDTDAKYIKHYTELNEQQTNALKQRTWDYCWIGVDWGYEDNAAIVVCVADKRTKEMFVVYDWSEPHQGNQITCEKVKEIYDNIKKEYNLARDPWVIADTNEKGNIADLYRIHKITHACCAYKYDKDAALDQLADFIHSNKIMFGNCPAVKNDMNLMLWKRDEESDKILHELDDDTYHGNAMFALLYVNRQFAVDVMGSTTAKTAKEIIEE